MRHTTNNNTSMENSQAPNPKWWSEDTVAVVTGSNKGIGYGIVRQLAAKGIRVILTAPEEQTGMAATKALNEAGFHNVVFHQMDVQDSTSINEFAKWIKGCYGKLDILVNNAGISGLTVDHDIVKVNKANPTQLFTNPENTVEGISENFEMAKMCMDINYYGTERSVEAFLPLLKLSGVAGGRIVNVSSRAGVLEFIPSESLRQQLSDLESLTKDKIDAFVQSFLKDFEQGLLKSNGWPVTYSAYFVSKAAVNAYTRVVARQNPDMYVNCVHPGFVRTDLNLDVGKLSIDEGAEGPVMVALLPPGSNTGQYYNEKEIGSFEILDKRDGA